MADFDYGHQARAELLVDEAARIFPLGRRAAADQLIATAQVLDPDRDWTAIRTAVAPDV